MNPPASNTSISPVHCVLAIRLPRIVAEASANGSLGWCVRVVPNKFPALQANMGYQHFAAIKLFEIRSQ